MPSLLRQTCCLLALVSLPLAAHAADPMPALQPLQASDLPEQCGCSFGEKKGVPLIFWSWENDKQNAVVREPGGLRKLTLRSEKYLPAQHEPPRPGDRMTLQLSWGNSLLSVIISSEQPRLAQRKLFQCLSPSLIA